MTSGTTVNVLYQLKMAEKTRLGHIEYISVKEMIVKEPNTEVEITRDDLKEHKSNIAAIIIDNNICHYFPRGFDKYFEHVRLIAVTKTELKVITREDIRPFSEIEYLHLNDNRLTKIEPKLFASNRNLREVVLNNNRIREISPDICDYFHGECNIELANNVCIQGSTKSLGAKDVTSEIIKKCQKTRQEIADNCEMMREKWVSQW